MTRKSTGFRPIRSQVCELKAELVASTEDRDAQLAALRRAADDERRHLVAETAARTRGVRAAVTEMAGRVRSMAALQAETTRHTAALVAAIRITIDETSRKVRRGEIRVTDPTAGLATAIKI